MKKRVGCFTEDKLDELSKQPNTVVYQPTHDITFQPWPASKVSHAVDEMIKITNEQRVTNNIQEACQKNAMLTEFSQKYTKFYEKLCDYEFVKDTENIQLLKRMILLKAAVDQNMTSAEAAQAQVSDIALKSLSSRVKRQQK